MELGLQLKIGNWILKLEFVYCSINKEIMTEKELREAWEKYQSTAHQEDMMSYVEFLSEQGIELED
jgi:hypothetical protein